MTDGNSPLTPYYEGWATYNNFLIESVGNLTGEQLLHLNSPSQRPVWSLAAHIVGARLYWLTTVAGEEIPSSAHSSPGTKTATRSTLPPKSRTVCAPHGT